MPSVIQLVNKVLPAGSQVVNGGMGLYNEVSWVIVVRPAPPGFNGLKGNEFVIIESSVAAGLGTTPVQLVATLAERGAGGIGWLGEISPETLKEAQARKIPLIQIPEGTLSAQLELEAGRLINEERQLLYQREREFNHALMEIALAGKGDSEVVQKLRELSGRQVGFIDLNYVPRFNLEPGLAEAFRQQVHQIVTKLRQDSASVTTPVVGLNLNQEKACFLGQIRVGREIKGYLLLVAPQEDISEADRLAVRAGAMALAVTMSRMQAVEETEARYESDVIEDLLTRDLEPVEGEEIAHRLGLDPASFFICCAARARGQFAEPVLLVKRIAGVFEKSISCILNNDLIILLPVETGRTTLELRKLGKNVFDEVQKIDGGELTCGVGRSYSGLAGLRNSYREAIRALNMGIQIFGNGSVTCFDDLGIYRLLFALKSGGELDSFYREYLGELVEYDRKHDGELLQTLKTYLLNSSLSDTARAIHVHRNTLLYRLTRIQEITGADLEDGETRLNLHIAILAGEVLNIH